MSVRRLVLLVVVLLAGAVVVAVGSIVALLLRPSHTEVELTALSHRVDPASVPLQRAFNSYVRRAETDNHVEIGIITLADGSTAKYWFQSHHLADGPGGTLFRMSDGTTSFMAGCFCCEVQLPEPPLSSLAALRSYIRACDGETP